MPELQTHPLKYPIELGDGSTVTEISWRRPTAADLRLIDKYRHDEIELSIRMIVALSDQPLKVIERLDAEDLGTLGERLMPNVEDGQKTGETR